MTLIYLLLDVWVGTYIVAISALTYVVVNWQNPILSYVPYLVAKRPWAIFITFLSVFAICAWGTSQVRIDSNMRWPAAVLDRTVRLCDWYPP